MNTGERIALLQKELEFEDERQEVLYAVFRKHCDLWSDESEKNLSSDDRQDLIILNQARKREEAEVLARRPEFLTWRSATETEGNLDVLLRSLKKTNYIVERIIEIMKKA